MRIGLCADSKGNTRNLERALDLLVTELHCQRVFFLGGHFADVDVVVQRRREPATGADSSAVFVDEIKRFVIERQLAKEGSGLVSESPKLFGAPLVRVPERGCDSYVDTDIPNIVLEMLGMHILLLVHNKGDLIKDQIANATIILHGSSAEPSLVQIGPRAFVSPGALAKQEAYVAVLDDAETGDVVFEAYSLDGEVRRSEPLQLRRGSRLTVR